MVHVESAPMKLPGQSRPDGVEGPGGPRPMSVRRWAVVVIGAGTLTFLTRLVPLLRGGGLYGLGNYDDGVYFTAAIGFVHGRLPYRDFLLLHPPGIVVALAPFAALGQVVGDPTAFALGRLAWMVLGAANAVLIARILRPLGLTAVVCGAVFYALFFPTIASDHTTELETLGTTLTLAALAVLPAARRATWPALLGGALLGAAASVKIWGALAVLVVAVVVAVSLGRRRGLHVLFGSVVGGTLVCGGFFAMAPATMWRMVVLDQLGRPQDPHTIGTRVVTILGQGQHTLHGVSAIVAVAGLVLVATVICSAWVPQARLALAVLVSSVAMLLLTPSWFPHYASLVAGPAAVCVGAGAGALVARTGATRPAYRYANMTVVLAVVLAYGSAGLPARVGSGFPGQALRAAVATVPGCVTADDPTTLIEMNVVGRNLDRGCSLVVDLGGWTYDHPPRPPVARAAYAAFQNYSLGHLRSGGAAINTRFHRGSGFSAHLVLALESWPVIARAGKFVLRRPLPVRGA
jgi:alpha-1,2-mannosyltransferase